MEYVLSKNFTIPAGTVFQCVDGELVRYISGNYLATVPIESDGHSFSIVINSDILKDHKKFLKPIIEKDDVEAQSEEENLIRN
jgi:hypothetical protein